MDFQAFDYMAWARRHQGTAAFDLSVSGMPAPRPELFPLDPAWLSLEGAGELRGALKARIAASYGVAAENVLLAAGTSEANFLVCGALLQPGDRVLAERPGYQGLTRLPTVFGATVDRFERDPDAEWAMDPERVAGAWRPGTRLLLLTTPHNPTGAVTPPAVLQALGDWLAERDAYALVDEVYRDFLPDAAPVAQALHPRLITTASLTKVYGLGALRAGWALAPREIVARAEQLYDFMGVNPPTTLLHAALAAFDARPALMERAWARAAENRAQLARLLGETPPLAGLLPPHGIVALLRLPGGQDAIEFVERLRVEQDTQLVPGDFFDAPGRVRVAYGGAPAEVAAALSRLRSFLASLSRG
jgi:aspartate/methionine/tyrosine aminotransferase